MRLDVGKLKILSTRLVVEWKSPIESVVYADLYEGVALGNQKFWLPDA